VEIKNLNSFKAVEKAVAYEIERHSRMLDQGEEIKQQTLGWNEQKQETVAQRMKEESNDYRYFPEPDLPPMKLSEVEEFSDEQLLASLPELPWQRRDRYLSWGIKEQTVEVLVSELMLGGFFDQVLKELDRPSEENKKVILSANYITSDLVGLMEEGGKEVPISAGNFADLIDMIYQEKLSSRGGKDVLAKMLEKDRGPEEIARQEGLLQSSDQGELQKLAVEVIKENPDPVKEYRAGKENSLKFLIGQAMKKSGGSANPQKMQELLKEELDK